MATSDDLRAKLIAKLYPRMKYAEHRSERFTKYAASRIVDALMPAITDALADAWDHGHRSVNPVVPDTHRDVINPWKQP